MVPEASADGEAAEQELETEEVSKKAKKKTNRHAPFPGTHGLPPTTHKVHAE